MSRVRFASDGIYIDDRKTQIVSGAIHYFRVPAEYWRDRLQKARNCGLNAVETYMCWNLHEPKRGEFHFEGNLDFPRFIRTAAEVGLYVIVRPGPYICAEWENGGIPFWVNELEGVEMRRMNKPFLEAEAAYMARVVPMLAPLQIDNGGPIIAMQIENEYGSYGNDKKYLAAARDMLLKNGATVPLFTGDGADDCFIINGCLEGTPETMTFGSRGLEAFAIGKRHRPNDPSISMEFWNGWFDVWGKPRQRRDAGDVAGEIDDMLAAGGSINMYMFHGGTNFAFWNGANSYNGINDFDPHTTSYDYDAPLSECGDPTEKYFKVQEVLRKYRPAEAFGPCEPSLKAAYGQVAFTGTASYFANLETVATKHETSVSPRTMEQMGQAFGFIHYRTHLLGPRRAAHLHLRDVRDRGIAFVNGKYLGTVYRNDEQKQLPPIEIPAEGATFDLLVENMGRTNYGPWLGRDPKGVTVGGMTVELCQPMGWEMWSLPLENAQLARLAFGAFQWDFRSKLPAFHKATLNIDGTPKDTFLRFPGTKGVVWINGHNIGRYWNIGPAKTLYVPGCWLKSGDNEITVFELEGLTKPYLQFDGQPDLG